MSSLYLRSAVCRMEEKLLVSQYFSSFSRGDPLYNYVNQPCSVRNSESEKKRRYRRIITCRITELYGSAFPNLLSHKNLAIHNVTFHLRNLRTQNHTEILFSITYLCIKHNFFLCVANLSHRCICLNSYIVINVLSFVSIYSVPNWILCEILGPGLYAPLLRIVVRAFPSLSLFVQFEPFLPVGAHTV